MELSIIIVNYNTKYLLERCLESVERYTIQNTRYEVIVVDNGSTDGSREYLKTQISNLKTKTQNLKLIFNTCNLGFSKAVNQGIKQAKGDAVLLLNSDTIVKDGALEKLVEFEKKVKPAIIGAKMLNNDGSVQGSCFFFPTINRAISEFWLNKGNYFSKYIPQEQNPIRVEAVSGGAMLISREVIDKIGLLDERYFMYF